MPNAPPLQIHYTVRVADARAHLLEVELVVRASGGGALPATLGLSMPVWSPGSYLVRDYARHVEGMTASAGGGALAVRKTAKSSWSLETGGAAQVALNYRVYANELSVRTNHVDEGHAYWNGASTYVVPDAYFATSGEAHVSVRVDGGWCVATALAPAAGQDRTFVARSADELLDSPFECGPMASRSFKLFGREHEVWVWRSPHHQAPDWARVLDDTRRIVETEARLIAGEGDPAGVLPYARYCFFWHVSPRGRGGLEHADSCTLLVPPQLFGSRAGYLDVLSLVAHEFFHLWNVKRVRPAGLVPYRYEAENYTRLLWWFEGGTSYFDWRVLRLAGLCSPREYADHLAGEIARLADTPGALAHPLADASFDAWVKAYRPDENSVNSTVSYYLKGEVVCALLDLRLRAVSEGRKGLDDVMRHLWAAYGAGGRPVPEHDFASIVEAATGVDVAADLTRWVETAAPVDPQPLLAEVGLRFERKLAARAPKSSLGLRARKAGGRALVDSVWRGSAAMRAGLDAGDELIAVGGRRVDEGQLDATLAHFEPGESVEVIVARDGFVLRRELTLDPARPGDGALVVRRDASPKQIALLRGWLGDDALASLRAGA